MKRDRKPETLLSRAGGGFDAQSGGVVPPIQRSTTFVRDENYDLHKQENSYGRDNNDQVRLAEDILAELEGAQDSMILSSGMAAISVVVSSLRTGQKLLLQSGIYWGTTHWARRFCDHRGVLLVEAPVQDAGEFSSLIAHEKPDMVFVETPSNPWIRIVDVEAVSAACRKAGALLVVDATAATPCLMQPLALGADLVVHSATKALNGHSDVLAGGISTANAESEIWQWCKAERHAAGAILSPQDAWLLIRGMRTLHLRIERMCANAEAIASALNARSDVEAVWYPSLKEHPGHDIAARQMSRGYGYLMSFLVAGGRDRALGFCRHLTGIHRATSLGGTESLVEHRHTVEGDLTGVPDNLIRLSVGIENASDLIAELSTALDRSAGD